MHKYIDIFLSIVCLFAAARQKTADDPVATESDPAITQPASVYSRPKLMDAAITSPVVDYPLLVLQEETSFGVDGIEPANIRHRPQLAQLYNGYAKIGGGSRLMGLGEVYYNSVRSRKYNWGIHAKHHSEWGQISDYAPSQYDNTSAKVFGKIEERRFSYGGAFDYQNQGLHYYGFNNPDADRDSIKQR